MSAIPKKVTTSQLAEFTGYTARWINEQEEKGVIKKISRGVFDFAASIRGIIDFHKRKDEPARERLTKAQASREERKDRMEAGEDIHAETVFKAWENVVLIFRERMLRVGNNVQSKCGLTESQRKAIDQEVSDGLRELEKKLIYQTEAADEEKESK